ncbi:hypothetical protein ANCCEY_05034 [Ancylostoma ceylanicum]|uniref:AF4/FMR2 C-terminal homology domain-containing protein n=1 Tax=Ancylostoma ceylanicum TaxID=53326 RepID=A0A0D6LVM7_9BILA|nr:hypothetical protein ANCCEY_05034 [Ancylostoma ceylanicum]
MAVITVTTVSFSAQLCFIKSLFIVKDYLNTAPSSSTHCSSDGHDSSAKKGKRNRAMDSDTEVEREKRRRGKDDSRDPPDKGISPDSGVHSAENDPGDENDVHSAQTIINLITKLSPPLSPIKQRPSDKKAERERREAELKERERRAREREEAREKEHEEKLRREKDREIRKQKEKERASSSEKKSKDAPDRKDKSLERKEKVKPVETEKAKSSTSGKKRDDSCLPRASSSQSHEDLASSHSRPSSAVSNHPSRSGFECAAEECAPTRPARPVKPEEGSTELLYDFYNSIARSRKRKGDAENALKTYTILAQMDNQIQEENQAQNGSSAPNTSSPGSSVHSNSNQSTTMVTMPSRVYDVQKQQLKTLHQLMWAHRVWQDAAKRADVSTTDMAFIGGLEKVCGALFLDAPLEKMSAYLLTGIAWLRGEYEREKVRPPPPTSKRTAAPS